LRSIIFWDMTPCSPLSFNRLLEEHIASILLARCFTEPIFSTLKMGAICSSETSVETQRTTQLHIPEDDTLHNHRCENLKSYKVSHSFQMQINFLLHVINAFTHLATTQPKNFHTVENIPYSLSISL
jgi:hypothetical protein